MSLSSRPVAQCCHAALRSNSTATIPARSIRFSSSQTYFCTRRRRSSINTKLQRRWQSSDAATSATNPKIAAIVDQISQLTLLETADLVSNLKSRLNIPDMPVFAPSAAGSPGAAPAPAAAEEEEAAPKPQEKTLFTLKLESFDAAAKPKIIKEVKSMLGLSLVDSKKFVESAPKVLKENVPKEEAEKIVSLLKGLGGVVKLE